MAKAGEAALQEKLDKIRQDYFSLVDRVKNENLKAASDLEKKLLKDEDEFKRKQEKERRDFEARLTREREDFKEKQKRERNISDREANERLKQAEDFIDNVKSPGNCESGSKLLSREEIRTELECPVCFAEMKPPVHIWQCAQGHPVCQPCRSRPEVRHCPTCRQRIVGRTTLVEKIAALVFEPEKHSESPGEYTTHPDSSPDTSPISSPEPSFRPRLPTYFLSLRQGTRIGNEDFSLNSLREARGVEEFFSTSPQRIVGGGNNTGDSDSDTREFDLGVETSPASFGFLD